MNKSQLVKELRTSALELVLRIQKIQISENVVKKTLIKNMDLNHTLKSLKNEMNGSILNKMIRFIFFR